MVQVKYLCKINGSNEKYFSRLDTAFISWNETAIGSLLDNALRSNFFPYKR